MGGLAGAGQVGTKHVVLPNTWNLIDSDSKDQALCMASHHAHNRVRHGNPADGHIFWNTPSSEADLSISFVALLQAEFVQHADLTPVQLGTLRGATSAGQRQGSSMGMGEARAMGAGHCPHGHDSSWE